MERTSETNKIIIAGIIQPEVGSGRIHLQDYIYDAEGISRTTCARDWKSPIQVLIQEES